MVAHDTPESVFAAARASLQRDDLAGAFGSFVRDDLLKVAGNSVRALSASDPGFESVCRQAGLDEATVRTIIESSAAMTESAARLTSDPQHFDGAAHHRIVKAYDASITAGLRSADDLPGFTASLEERMRARMGGGSISTSLFDGEVIVDVEIDADGKRAWATRVRDDGTTEDIGFARQRDGWKIRLFARPPRR